MLSEKNPVFVESGRRGARVRWGDTPRVVRMDQLRPEEAAVVHALLKLAASRDADGPETEMTAQSSASPTAD